MEKASTSSKGTYTDVEFRSEVKDEVKKNRQRRSTRSLDSEKHAQLNINNKSTIDASGVQEGRDYKGEKDEGQKHISDLVRRQGN
jgi:hypothetical protein